jgi:hypothetical protein
MKKPGPDIITWYEGLLPLDPRVVKGQMFGHPCAFVNGNMFFGTFGNSVIVRVGAEKAAEIAGERLGIFEPMGGRPWKEYVQADPDSLPDAELAVLVRVALDATAVLPPKEKAPKEKAPKGKAAQGKAAKGKKEPAAADAAGKK